MQNKLKTLSEVIREIAERYGVNFEIAESIIKDYINVQYYTLTGREIEEDDLLL